MMTTTPSYRVVPNRVRIKVRRYPNVIVMEQFPNKAHGQGVHRVIRLLQLELGPFPHFLVRKAVIFG